MASSNILIHNQSFGNTNVVTSMQSITLPSSHTAWWRAEKVLIKQRLDVLQKVLRANGYNIDLEEVVSAKANLKCKAFSNSCIMASDVMISRKSAAGVNYLSNNSYGISEAVDNRGDNSADFMYSFFDVRRSNLVMDDMLGSLCHSALIVKSKFAEFLLQNQLADKFMSASFPLVRTFGHDYLHNLSISSFKNGEAFSLADDFNGYPDLNPSCNISSLEHMTLMVNQLVFLELRKNPSYVDVLDNHITLFFRVAERIANIAAETDKSFAEDIRHSTRCLAIFFVSNFVPKKLLLDEPDYTKWRDILQNAEPDFNPDTPFAEVGKPIDCFAKLTQAIIQDAQNYASRKR